MSENQGKLRAVVLVGHCIPDAHMLKTVVSRAIPGATISIANDSETLRKHLSAGALLLINRMLDGSFVEPSGIAIIQELAQRADRPRMMLISNFPDAQDAAVQAGALRGFGKSQLYEQATASALREAIAG